MKKRTLDKTVTRQIYPFFSNSYVPALFKLLPVVYQIDHCFFSLLSLLQSTLSCELVCKKSIPLKRQKKKRKVKPRPSSSRFRYLRPQLFSYIAQNGYQHQYRSTKRPADRTSGVPSLSRAVVTIRVTIRLPRNQSSKLAA